MKRKGALVLWKFKFCAKNHLVKVGTLNWCIKHTVYIHKGTVQRHLCLIEGVYLPLRGKQGVFSLKKFASVSLYMAKHDIKALCLKLDIYNFDHRKRKSNTICKTKIYRHKFYVKVRTYKLWCNNRGSHFGIGSLFKSGV